MGGLPLLARIGTAEVELAFPAGKVLALGVDGHVLGEIPVRRSGRGICFDAETNRYAEDAVFCYHISR